MQNFSGEESLLHTADLSSGKDVSADGVAGGVSDAKLKYEQLQGKVEMLTGVVEQLISKVESFEQGRQAGGDKQNLMNDLDEKIPLWREFNEDERFIDWLAQLDQEKGLTNRELLDFGVSNNDVDLILSLFDQFMKEIATTDPEPVKEKALQQPVEPVKTGNAANSNLPDKKMWTSDEIGKFYGDLVRGHYKGSEKRAKEIEKDIEDAILNQRVKA